MLLVALSQRRLLRLATMIGMRRFTTKTSINHTVPILLLPNIRSILRPKKLCSIPIIAMISKPAKKLLPSKKNPPKMPTSYLGMGSQTPKTQ